MGYSFATMPTDRAITIGPDERLWSINSSGAIINSSDGGNTWSVHATPVHSSSFTVYADAQGNCYFSSFSGGKVYRIDATTKAETAVITLTDANMFVVPWGFTEDLDGNIYIGQYGNEGVGPHGYIWKAAAGGTSFSRIDHWASYKHIHNVKCNPYDGSVWVTVGDSPKRTYRSTNGLATIGTQVGGDETGYTGLTFFSDGRVIASDDLAVGSNAVWELSSLTPVKLFDMPYPYNTMTYCAVARGQELWLTPVDESISSATNTAVLLYTYSGTWDYEVVLDAAGTAFDYMWLSMNPNGICPLDYGIIVSDSVGVSTRIVPLTLTITSTTHWTQSGTTLTVTAPRSVRTTCEASVVSALGGTLRFTGTHADRFTASLDGVTYTATVEVPAGTTAVWLGATPEATDGGLSVQVGVWA